MMNIIILDTINAFYCSRFEFVPNEIADKVCNSMILDYLKFYLNFVQIFNIKLNNFTNGNQKYIHNL